MKNKLREYLDVEIPILNKKKGLKRFILFLKEMRYSPSHHAIYMLRYCYVYFNENGIRKYIRMHYIRKLVNMYGIFFNINSDGIIGKGLFLPHPTSIVFGEGINIGENCTIYQNVTLGAKKRDEKAVTVTNENRYPTIGDNCIFYAGSVANGGIQVANGTQVGANAVLISDTQEYSVYAGIPAVRKR